MMSENLTENKQNNLNTKKYKNFQNNTKKCLALILYSINIMTEILKSIKAIRREGKTMLRTNSKAARTNVMAYIREDWDYIAERAEYQNIPLHQIEDDNNYCRFIWDIFKEEKGHEIERAGFFKAFEDWAQGLSLGGMFLYYYNISAVDTLGDILEETKEERSRYTETQAEQLLTKLIYREIRDRASYAL